MYQDTGTWPVGHLPSFSPSVYHGCVYPSWTQTHVILFPLLSKCWDDVHMTPNCCIFTISFWQTHSFIFIIFTSSKWKCLLKYSSNAFWVAKNWSFQRNETFLFCCFIIVSMGPRVLFLPDQCSTTELQPQPKNYISSGASGKGWEKVSHWSIGWTQTHPLKCWNYRC